MPVERDPWQLVRFCEARFDRGYDDQHASWVASPGGWVCSFSREFLAAAVRAALVEWGALADDFDSRE